MAKNDPERARRLADALRTNLRRRKAQDRARDAVAPAEIHTDDADPGDSPPGRPAP